MTTRTIVPQDTSDACRATAATWLALPAALRRELRTDHAGEAGAVMIYGGVLAMARSPALRAFARHHLQTEQQHLVLIEAVVPPAGRSRLLPLWRLAGWLTGALPAVLGPHAVYATIDAVETFVDAHYAAQVGWIDRHSAASGQAGHADPAARAAPAAPALQALRALLERCRLDEVLHRDDARVRRGTPGRGPVRLLALCWAAVVAGGSAAAVRISRWV